MPHTGKVSFEWAVRFKELQLPAYMSWAIGGNQGAPVDMARNVLVTNALRDHSRYIFFVDSDVLMRSNTLTQLVSHSLPIVSGIYFSRANTQYIVANINNRALTWNELAHAGQPLVEVTECGTGCLLIDMRVFHRIMQVKKLPFYCITNHNPPGQPKKKAEFDWKTARDNDFLCPECKKNKGETNILVAEFFEYDLLKPGPNFESEDYYFCRIAREVGFRVFIDMNAVVSHESAPMHIDERGVVNPVISVMDLGGRIAG